MKITVLVADEDEQFRELLARRLEATGFTVKSFGDPEEAVRFTARHQVDVALLGLQDDDPGAVALLTLMKSVRPHLEVIVLAAKGTVEFAMTVMRLGACDCFPKVLNVGDLIDKVEEVKKRKHLRAKEARRVSRSSRAKRQTGGAGQDNAGGSSH